MPTSSTRLVISNDSGFGAYWVGQSVSSLGSQVAAIALPLVAVITLDAGPGVVGLVAGAAMLPYLLLSLVVGHHLEGRAQRPIMIAASSSQAVLVALVPLTWASGLLSVPLLVGIAFLNGTCAVVVGIASFAYLPALVRRDDLAPANRAVQASRTVSEIVGPGVAGTLVSVAGPPLALVLDAVSYVVSAVGIARSRPRTADEPVVAREGRRSRITTGLRIIFENHHLRALTVHAALYNLAEQILIVNLVVWAVKEQQVGEFAYGLSLSAGGVGGVIGTLVAIRLSDRLGLGRALMVSLVLSCFLPVLIAVWPADGVVLAVVIAAVMMVARIGEGNANIYSVTLRQVVIPPARLARSAGAYTQVMYGSIPLGSFAAGLIGERFGARTGVLAGGVALVLSALPMMTRSIARLESFEDATVTRGEDVPGP